MKHTTTQTEKEEIKHTQKLYDVIFKYPNPIPYECIGVYAIKNTKTGKMYIGSSKNLKKRTLQHIALLKTMHGCNLKMRAEIRRKTDLKYIEFHVLQYFYDGDITDYQLAIWERKFINLLDTIKHGYNYDMPTICGRNEKDNKIYTRIDSENAWRYPTDPKPEEEPKPAQENISVIAPKGTKEKIKEYLPEKQTVNGLINDLINSWLNDQERQTDLFNLPDLPDLEDMPFH